MAKDLKQGIGSTMKQIEFIVRERTYTRDFLVTRLHIVVFILSVGVSAINTAFSIIEN